MEERLNRVVSPPTEVGAAEERMLRADLVREMVARKERGEGAKRIARELGVDRKTVKRWLKLGSWRPRRSQFRRAADRSVCRVHRAARAGGRVERGGCTSRAGGLGVYRRVSASQRFLQPFRARRKWSALATVRFETAPGEQAQVDYGQLKVWIGEQAETVHLFVFTLGYSRRLFTRGYRNERLATLLDGHERAFRFFRRRHPELPVR